jgi:endonuclease-3
VSEVQGQGQGLGPPDALAATAGHPAKAGRVHERLVEACGPRVWRSHAAPLDELIATVLSQHTSDVNSARAFQSLRRAFPTWDHVLAAGVDEIAAAIRVGGLAGVKAPRIKACLAGLAERYGVLSLDFLADLSIAEARSILEAIPGVGPKTAACVLLFSLGRPALPVDTHVHRVSERLGLVPPGASPEQVERQLEAQLPPKAYYAFHVNLIAHGRRTCRTQRPRCEACPLSDLCDYRLAADGHQSGAAGPETRSGAPSRRGRGFGGVRRGSPPGAGPESWHSTSSSNELE